MSFWAERYAWTAAWLAGVQSEEAAPEADSPVITLPDRDLVPTDAEEGRKLLQECRDQLADAEFNVGRFYFKTRKHCRAAVARLKGVLENYPTYSHLDRVYFYLGQSHVLCGMPTEAMPYYQQLLDNYPESEHREEAEEVLSKLQEASVS